MVDIRVLSEHSVRISLEDLVVVEVSEGRVRGERGHHARHQIRARVLLRRLLMLVVFPR